MSLLPYSTHGNAGFLTGIHICYMNMRKTDKISLSIFLHKAVLIIDFLLGTQYPKHTFELHTQTPQLNM